MKRVHFVMDEKKHKIAVQVDSRTGKELSEDFCDYLIC